ncbi:MerR family transcriptional regulator [Nocardioides litoris]|uniref:MerR family transcriptional regulator n=1 Tax=Nocardioides litoris TaxID=1926648 RepID=UPI0011218CBB|nr:MerR family transcriptional regulator [Nocardioides litoris]
MRIGDLARQTGASERSLRYYEEQGLLHSDRSPAGQRLYDDAAVDRVAWIQRLYAAGLSSRVLVDLLPCVETPSEATTRSTLDRLREEHARLGEHVDELVRTRETLAEVIACSERHLAAPAAG